MTPDPQAQVERLKKALESVRQIITNDMRCNHPDEAERLTPETETFVGLCSGSDCIYCAVLDEINMALSARAADDSIGIDAMLHWPLASIPEVCPRCKQQHQNIAEVCELCGGKGEIPNGTDWMTCGRCTCSGWKDRKFECSIPEAAQPSDLRSPERPVSADQDPCVKVIRDTEGNIRTVIGMPDRNYLPAPEPVPELEELGVAPAPCAAEAMAAPVDEAPAPPDPDQDDVDPKCFDLAQHFLGESASFDDNFDLAKAFQAALVQWHLTRLFGAPALSVGDCPAPAYRFDTQLVENLLNACEVFGTFLLETAAGRTSVPADAEDNFIISQGTIADIYLGTLRKIDDARVAVAQSRVTVPESNITEGRLPLLQKGDFILHSGFDSSFKIECDALTDADWAGAAQIIAELVSPFGTVEGVPRGGLKLASALQPYATEGPLLIVDDVLTTGASMEAHRACRDAIGAVLFARGNCPEWVTPVFAMGLKAQVAAARAEDKAKGREWQPIETAPKDGTKFIGCMIDTENKNRIWRAHLAYWDRIGWYEVQSGSGLHFLTHWMPLPDPPKESA